MSRRSVATPELRVTVFELQDLVSLPRLLLPSAGRLLYCLCAVQSSFVMHDCIAYMGALLNIATPCVFALAVQPRAVATTEATPATIQHQASQ